MAAHKGDRIAELIKEVEAVAKRLRTDVRKRADASTKTLASTAARLRKQAATVAGHVEKYVHEIRTELEGAKKAPAKRKKSAAKKARPKKSAASSGL